MHHNKSDALLHPERIRHLSNPEARSSWEGPAAGATGDYLHLCTASARKGVERSSHLCWLHRCCPTGPDRASDVFKDVLRKAASSGSKIRSWEKQRLGV